MKNNHKSVFSVRSTNELISQKETINLLIKAIQLYKKDKINLDDMVKLAKIIEKYSNPSVSQRLRSITSEICSFSHVDDILNDILSELTQGRKNK